MRAGRETELWNAMLSYAGRPLPFAGSKATLQFAAAEAPEPSVPALLIQPAAGPAFAVIVTSFPFKAMFGADITMAEVQELAPSVRDSINEGVVATLWNAVPDKRLGGFRIGACAPLSDIARDIGARDWKWLAMTLQGIAPEPVTALVGQSVSVFVDAVAGGTLASAAVANAIKTQLLIEVFFSLGSLTLTMRGLGELRSGDMVVLPELGPDRIMVRAGWTCYEFRRAAQGWACSHRELAERYRSPASAKGMTAMNEEAGKGDRPTPEAVPIDFGALGIAVDFDLGRTTVPLAALQAWQPGTVVPLEPPAATEGVEVTVRANGQVIGHGDLVRIDDRFAVRLTRITIDA
jgi:type III secretion system YscQ/HrcQ family protein